MVANSGDVLDTMIGGDAPSGNTQEAGQILEQAMTMDSEGDRDGAIQMLRKAAQANGCAEVIFRLAYLLDLGGEEDEAVGYYAQLTQLDRPHINALLNLAVIFEDQGNISRAEKCIRQVLDTNPNHERAILFMKDIQASRDMYYDEEQARDVAKRNAMLDTPVTDFELSVRARNCLKKMQIRTLGDLLKVSEAELLSYKNFGETSLVEIKKMLSMKGLRLGQNIEHQYSRVREEILDQLKGVASESVLNKSITQLDFSVRARKALQLLGVQTVGDLATRTEAELMGVKNFGATSLDETKDKLASFGLTLRMLD
ncbi:MAG: DNA-directed RNA polymerase subunit alpha C-terminal domain-containing protein [Phycisphaerales bacterium]|nr:DNA-directed RNA polymerase subunit alpha C-terminal domain-containing protein [Phycisphaerales bacterium]